MGMNKNLQKYSIGKKLKTMGIESDLFDLHAHIDSTLTLNENTNNIIGMSGLNKKRNSNSGRFSSMELSMKAQSIFSDRSPKKQEIDNRKRAKNTFSMETLTNKQFKKWKKKPNRYDIEGIDTEGGFI